MGTLSPRIALVLLDALYKTEVFKRCHLVALSGINENTLKVYLPLLNKASRRMTEERKASRFTGVEAMAVIIMAALQHEWGMRPEFSFMVAWRTAFNFCYEMNRAQKQLSFPEHTFAVSFPPEVLSAGRCGIHPDEFAQELGEQYFAECFSFIGITDKAIREKIFEPMMDLRKVVTGVDLFWEHTLEARRNDA